MSDDDEDMGDDRDYSSLTHPAFALLGLYLTAGVVHLTHMPSWLVVIIGIVLGGAITAAVAAYDPGPLATGYTAAVSFVALIWLTYVSITTPYSLPAIVAIAAAGLVFGAWYHYVRHVTYPSYEPEEDVWAEILDSAGLPHMRTLATQTHDGGLITVHMKIAAGSTSMSDVTGAKEKIEIHAARRLKGTEKIMRRAIQIEEKDEPDEFF